MAKNIFCFICYCNSVKSWSDRDDISDQKS